MIIVLRWYKGGLSVSYRLSLHCQLLACMFITNWLHVSEYVLKYIVQVVLYTAGIKQKYKAFAENDEFFGCS